ncbi:MAG TPA: protein kinase, partial [Phototrophicaceae bacterium]|nr:protein kinase [Phototrophicaceae bacterium]
MQADRLSPLIGSRYRLESQLGRGGMGAVYRALDDLTGEEVALKRVLTPTQNLQFASRISDNSTASESTNLRLALAQEFHTLASLRHPNIIRVLDYGFDADRQPYLTMDLLHEPRNLLEAGKGQPLGVKINLLIQTLQALAYLHRREVIHRDLKPDNIAVVAENGAPHVRVLDFGLALTMPDSLHTGGQGIAGTLAYMAPEILQGGQASVASDLYALGVIAFEMLAGKHPFQGDSTATLVNNILKTDPDLTPLLALQPQRKTDELILIFDSSGQSKFRATLIEIIDKLLAKHPSDRYDDAYAVINDLCAAADLPLPEESDAIRESFLQAARFVGREIELHLLRRALSDASEGKGSLWLVGGESGVGKSRLLDELRKWALIEGVLTLRGQAVSSGGQPFQLWHDPLRRLILSTGLHHEEASVLSTILPEISMIFDDVPPPPAGSDLQARLTEIIIDLFQRHPEPMVLLLEDLQWGAEGLQALKGLASFIGDLPLLIVGSFRDDERPRLPDELPQAQLISLTRFDQDEIALLTRSMLGEARSDVLDYLRRETEGNAFFLVETVRALAEEAGRLSEIGREALPEHLFVGGVQEVIWRRLNRVPPSARGLMKLAAVIGRELDLQLLGQALRTGVYGPARLHGLDLEDWVTTCANRAVFEWDGSGWRFAHDKLREALLDALMPDENVAYHREA